MKELSQYSPAEIEAIAVVCHQANKAWCELHEDNSQVDWADAPDWQKDSARNGVVFVLSNPDASPSASHENWRRQKHAEGWVFGIVKDAEHKEHPCMVPFEELPENQQKKDKLFRGIVLALA